jgi:hypothetical protein
MNELEYCIIELYASLAEIKGCAMVDYDNPQRALILDAVSILRKQVDAFKIAMEAVK